MTSDAQEKTNRKELKVSPHAHIGYLLNYLGSYPYEVWLPETGQIVTSRDVRFDETSFFDPNQQCTPPLLLNPPAGVKLGRQS